MKENARYQEPIDCGNAYRNTYHQGLEAILQRLQAESVKRRDLLLPELRLRPEAFRSRLRQTLGWPLTEPARDRPSVRTQFVASDDLADIYRLQIEIQPDLWMYGILFLQQTEAPLPLVLSQHGGFGTPELCSGFFDSGNYHDMTRRILKKGVHVFCPQLFLWHAELFGDTPYDRRQFDHALKCVGSSIAAVELDGLQKCIDYLQTLPQVRPDSIGMIGLSYGGFYSLLLAALDQRIQAVMSSCFFNTAEAHKEFTDCAWFNSGNQFQDAEIAALIYPRKAWIQVADHDELFPCELAAQEFARLKKIYEEVPSYLHFEVFQGVHEFSESDVGIDFVVHALKDHVL